MFNKTSFKPIDVATVISDFVQEYNRANRCGTKPSRAQQHLRWQPPNPGTTKINIDGGCFENGAIGWGMLVKDHEGNVSFVATKFERMNISPTMAEALSLRWCLQWAKEQDLGSLIIETDAKVIVKCLQGIIKLATIKSIILDCKELLSYMPNSCVTNIRKERNNATHGLVGVARNSGSRTWMGNVPGLFFLLPVMNLFASNESSMFTVKKKKKKINEQNEF